MGVDAQGRERTNLLRLQFIYCVRKRFVAQLKTSAAYNAAYAQFIKPNNGN